MTLASTVDTPVSLLDSLLGDFFMLSIAALTRRFKRFVLATKPTLSKHLECSTDV